MTKERPSPTKGGANLQSAVRQRPASLDKISTTGQIVFNIVLAVLGLFAAAIMFSLGLGWANQGSMSAGIGLILAGLFVFWRGGTRLSWICTEIRLRRQK